MPARAAGLTPDEPALGSRPRLRLLVWRGSALVPGPLLVSCLEHGRVTDRVHAGDGAHPHQAIAVWIALGPQHDLVPPVAPRPSYHRVQYQTGTEQLIHHRGHGRQGEHVLQPRRNLALGAAVADREVRLEQLGRILAEPFLDAIEHRVGAVHLLAPREELVVDGQRRQRRDHWDPAVVFFPGGRPHRRDLTHPPARRVLRAAAWLACAVGGGHLSRRWCLAADRRDDVRILRQRRRIPWVRRGFHAAQEAGPVLDLDEGSPVVKLAAAGQVLVPGRHRDPPDHVGLVFQVVARALGEAPGRRRQVEGIALGLAPGVAVIVGVEPLEAHPPKYEAGDAEVEAHRLGHRRAACGGGAAF